MNPSIRFYVLSLLSCFLFAGCSSSEPQNVAETASQEEIDNYNALIEQAEQEMQGDGEVDDLTEE